MKKFLIILSFTVSCVCSCDSFLEPMRSGYYTDENLNEYPSLIKGFVDKSYSLATYNSYLSAQYAYLDCAADNGVMTSASSACRQLGNGKLMYTADPFVSIWRNAYDGIYYVNRFLKDDIGYRTKYLVSEENDQALRRLYKGDAFAIRAWLEYELLVKFGGMSESGRMLGFVIVTDAIDQNETDESDYERAGYDECVAQVLADCDSALVYLPIANRDWLSSNLNVEGSMRWSRFDGISVIALKSLVYLQWASDRFNEGGDTERWKKAAEYASEAMKFKLEEDFPQAGASPYDPVSWTEPNPVESYYSSRAGSKSTEYETAQYPVGFKGSATFAPSQELVDAFPMSNGYPITHPHSGYNPEKPYNNRDPRFYDNILYNGAKIYRAGNPADLMYTIEAYTGGKDAPGLKNTSLTGYYLKKFLYMGWNGSDRNIQSVARSVHHITWRDMCLTFAEAANRAFGPEVEYCGFTAKQALAYIRGRSSSDGKKGVGASADPYMDECCASMESFEALVRNERRLEFCFEGKRFFDLTRWNVPMAERNRPVHKAVITMDAGKLSYDFTSEADTRNMASPYLPIPISEMTRTSNIEQNEGWKSWE